MGTDRLVDDFEKLPVVEDNRPLRRIPYTKFALGIFFFVCLGAAAYSYLQVFQDSRPALDTSDVATTCSPQNSRTRREWRSFSDVEKDTYLGAVQCLQNTPGKVADEQSLFQDFAFSHSRTGKTSHKSALFLPWHRLFLIAYEDTLRSQCRYTGDMPYWNWSLDHEGLADAPVWATERGFGGNGTIPRLENGMKAVGNGSCVTDGPFANATCLYLSHKKRSHCLSRGFVVPGTNASDDSHHNIHPDRIETVLSQESYASFWAKLEDGPHDAIPHFIRGDFFFLTAPSDPIFFLHHAQLDRLWWLWQMRGLPQRLTEYEGYTNSSSTEPASVSDTIELGGLWPDAPVADVVDTMGGFLCYKYE